MAERVAMRAKYIGEEDMPGSKSTVLFGKRVVIGEAFDVPRGLEHKAHLNPYVQVMSEAKEPDGSASAPKKPKDAS